MNITSRYADNPKVSIDPAKVPAEFRHLLPLANEWSIGDDNELDLYIAAASEQQKSELIAAFGPHFAGLWKWHESVSYHSACLAAQDGGEGYGWSPGFVSTKRRAD